MHISAEPIPLSELEQRKRYEIDDACTAALNAATAGTPAAEIDTWSTQVAEAAAWRSWKSKGGLSINKPSTPLLTRLAAARGLPIADLVARVEARAAVFTTQAGDLIGRRQAKADQINAVRASLDSGAIDPSTARARFEAITW
ncbi:hypothetical protein [Salinisphaera sp. T31B1]|uniref:hypothetical protein n=1 Tax=Salinisphaera sp. T31B1 TaxID=727963 RepID=UPI00333E1E60